MCHFESFDIIRIGLYSIFVFGCTTTLIYWTTPETLLGKPVIYLFIQKLEGLETYFPVKLKLNVNWNLVFTELAK